MSTQIVRDALPASFDVRVTRALALPFPDDAVVAVEHVAMEKSVSANFRWQLHRDGALYYVQHSGKPGDWQVPFDRELPSRPAKVLTPAEVDGLLAALDAGGFFSHPGYEANPNYDGGSYWIVRARKAGVVHPVVFQNTRPDYVDKLTAVSDPLWTQPR